MADSSVYNSDFSMASYNPNIPFGVPIESIPMVSNTVYAQQWMAQRGNYYQYWRWFDGRALEVTDPSVKTGDASVYPLRINPIEMICLKHAAALFGEVPDESDNMVQFQYKNADNESDPLCDKTSDVLSSIWTQNSGRALQQQNALVSQYLGGSVFKISWDATRQFNPEEADMLRPSRIRIESILPDFFLPVYDLTDPYNLIECYVMYYITAQEAMAKYNVEITTPTQIRVLYCEHWTKDTFEIQVGGQTATFIKGNAEYNMKGKNEYGIVPFVYIPHARRTGGFYGWSHVPSLIGLTKELNARLADIGDNVQDNAQAIYWARNVAYAIKVRKVEEQITILDLGGAGPSGRDPALERLDVPATNTMATSYVQEMWNYIEKAASVPGVGWGDDEGSQRSALTLSVRMWSLTSHIRDERSNWTIGLRHVNRIILRILQVKDSPLFKKGMEKLSCRVKWYSIMPRERLEQVEEVVTRKGVHLISMRQAVSQLNNSEDVDNELKEIQKDIDLEQKMALKVQNSYQQKNEPTN